MLVTLFSGYLHSSHWIHQWNKKKFPNKTLAATSAVVASTIAVIQPTTRITISRWPKPLPSHSDFPRHKSPQQPSKPASFITQPTIVWLPLPSIDTTNTLPFSRTSRATIIITRHCCNLCRKTPPHHHVPLLPQVIFPTKWLRFWSIFSYRCVYRDYIYYI